ncbi:kinase-like domain-containing protein [Schizophyllum amplum]|uniref:non-specific serine/threonine protein kinase n=1 Tax=Schizophyllum amplum TaxID=97359 RepID=A0A550BYE0_9AGAR|nr:kinase-like domain-containing protein [Auriculariopsis ampla]
MRLELEDIIGFGGYGESSKVYIGCVTSHPTTSTVVAVKRSRWAWKITNPMLRHEACALLMLRGHPNIPVVYAWDRSQGFEYLVMERLGRDLASSLASTGGLTMPNLVALTCQMLDAIQHVHAHHIVHCDIKPHNFLFDLNPASGLIKLIDFGFARVYRDSSTLEHVGESTMRHLIGTKAYASLNVHLHHHNPSRRDDLESLAYTVVKLLCGALPWRDLRSADTCAAKQKWFGSALCAGYPPVFGQFVDYVRALGFREAPGYNGWIRRFMAVAPQLRGHPLYDASDHGPRQQTVRSHLDTIEKPPRSDLEGETMLSDPLYAEWFPRLIAPM